MRDCKEGVVWHQLKRGGGVCVCEMERNLHTSTLAYIHLAGDGGGLSASLLMLVWVCLAGESEADGGEQEGEY